MILFLTQDTVKCIFYECSVITSLLNTQWTAPQNIVLHKLHTTSCYLNTPFYKHSNIQNLEFSVHKSLKTHLNIIFWWVDLTLAFQAWNTPELKFIQNTGAHSSSQTKISEIPYDKGDLWAVCYLMIFSSMDLETFQDWGGKHNSCWYPATLESQVEWSQQP